MQCRNIPGKMYIFPEKKLFYLYIVNLNFPVSDNYQKHCKEDFECDDFRLVCEQQKQTCCCTRYGIHNW